MTQKQIKQKLDDSFTRVRQGTGSGKDFLGTRAVAAAPIAIGTAIAGMLWVETHEMLHLEPASEYYFMAIVIWLFTSILASFSAWRKR